MTIAEVVPTLKETELAQEQEVVLDRSWCLADESGLADVAAKYAEQFGIGVSDQTNRFELLRDEELAEEEYLIAIAPGDIEVKASSRRGFLHALATLNQLRNGPVLPVGSIRDYPRLPLRGLHFMFESVKQLRFEDAMRLIESAAKHKLNAILMEFGDRFPFEGEHSVITSPSALTASELTELLDHARDLGIQVIPLLQSLGHLNYLLRHDEYAHIREEDEVRAQMCPLNESSFVLWTELAEQVLEFFPDCTLMHIGADETRQLGECPRCAVEVESSGKGLLYTRHINKVCAWLADRGIAPMLWDDILCAHPETMDHLHEAAQIMYWDYWTTCDPSPLLVARGSGSVCYDERWDDEWAGELSEVTRKALDRFARPVRLDRDLTDEYLAIYRDYLGDQLPKHVRAFPYLEYYQDRGRTVFGGPTCAGNHSSWHTLPDLPRYGENIKTFADRCIEADAAGLITTAWYNLTPETLHFGIIATAEFTW
jgi:uncharacterized C2H2 Zn-finger protein